MTAYQHLHDAIQQAVYAVIDPPIRLLVRCGATPNMMTTVGLVGNLAAAALIVATAYNTQFEALMGLPARYGMLGWAGALTLLFSIFDMVDGRMARTAHLESRFGAFYDSVLDRYCELATLCALAFFFMLLNRHAFALWTALALIGSIMVSYVRARAEGLGCECKVGLMQRPERVVLTALGLLLTGLMQDTVSPLFDPLWLIAAPIIVIALLANATAIARITHVRKQLNR